MSKVALHLLDIFPNLCCARLIDEAMEHLTVLIALRKASESMPPGRVSSSSGYLNIRLPPLTKDKRNKRPRAPSPSRGSTPGTPSLGSTKITVPPKRDGTIPHIPFSRDPKARREALSKQLPLQEGRKVAFHPPATKASDGTSAEVDENTWILAVVVQCINQDKNRYFLDTNLTL